MTNLYLIIYNGFIEYIKNPNVFITDVVIFNIIEFLFMIMKDYYSQTKESEYYIWNNFDRGLCLNLIGFILQLIGYFIIMFR